MKTNVFYSKTGLFILTGSLLLSACSTQYNAEKLKTKNEKIEELSRSLKKDREELKNVLEAMAHSVQNLGDSVKKSFNDQANSNSDISSSGNAEVKTTMEGFQSTLLKQSQQIESLRAYTTSLGPTIDSLHSKIDDSIAKNGESLSEINSQLKELMDWTSGTQTMLVQLGESLNKTEATKAHQVEVSNRSKKRKELWSKLGSSDGSLSEKIQMATELFSLFDFQSPDLEPTQLNSYKEENFKEFLSNLKAIAQFKDPEIEATPLTGAPNETIEALASQFDFHPTGAATPLSLMDIVRQSLQQFRSEESNQTAYAKLVIKELPWMKWFLIIRMNTLVKLAVARLSPGGSLATGSAGVKAWIWNWTPETDVSNLQLALNDLKAANETKTLIPFFSNEEGPRVSQKIGTRLQHLLSNMQFDTQKVSDPSTKKVVEALIQEQSAILETNLSSIQN